MSVQANAHATVGIFRAAVRCMHFKSYAALRARRDPPAPATRAHATGMGRMAAALGALSHAPGAALSGSGGGLHAKMSPSRCLRWPCGPNTEAARASELARVRR